LVFAGANEVDLDALWGFGELDCLGAQAFAVVAGGGHRQTDGGKVCGWCR